MIASAALAAAGIAVSWRPLRIPLAIVLLILLIARQAPPLDAPRRWCVESQREAANMAGRRAITAYLHAHYDGSDDHDEHGLARPLHARPVAGRVRPIKDFLHEGNGEIWRFAMLGPRGHAGLADHRGIGRRWRCAPSAASLRPRWLDGFEHGGRRRRGAAVSGDRRAPNQRFGALVGVLVSRLRVPGAASDRRPDPGSFEPLRR